MKEEGMKKRQQRGQETATFRSDPLTAEPWPLPTAISPFPFSI